MSNPSDEIKKQIDTVMPAVSELITKGAYTITVSQTEPGIIKVTQGGELVDFTPVMLEQLKVSINVLLIVNEQLNRQRA